MSFFNELYEILHDFDYYTDGGSSDAKALEKSTGFPFIEACGRMDFDVYSSEDTSFINRCNSFLNLNRFLITQDTESYAMMLPGKTYYLDFIREQDIYRVELLLKKTMWYGTSSDNMEQALEKALEMRFFDAEGVLIPNTL
jgi:hypothetical protein